MVLGLRKERERERKNVGCHFWGNKDWEFRGENSGVDIQSTWQFTVKTEIYKLHM